MSITGGIKFFEPSFSLLKDGATAVVSTGDSTKNNAIDKNPLSVWRSVGSGQATVETYELTITAAKTINRLALVKHNLLDFDIKYHNGTSFVDFSNVVGINGSVPPGPGISETAFLENTAYYEFDEVSTDKILLTARKVQDSTIGAAEDLSFFASYGLSVNGNFGLGVLTGTPVGGASISGGRLDLKGGTVQYVDYSANLNADSIQQGAVEFDFYPDYNGSPSTNITLFTISEAAGNNDNAVALQHRGSGDFRMIVRDSGGTLIVGGNIGVFTAVLGQKYVVSLNWDITTGATRLFVDGVQKGATNITTGTRDGNIGLIRVGSSETASSSPEFEIANFVVFSEVQHTADYTPEPISFIALNKRVSQIILTKEFGTYVGYPIVRPISFNRNARNKKMLSGKALIQKGQESASFRISLRNYPPSQAADIDLTFELHERDADFIVWLCGGRSGPTFFKYQLRGFRLQDFITMNTGRPIRVSYKSNTYTLPVMVDMSLEEVV